MTVVTSTIFTRREDRNPNDLVIFKLGCPTEPATQEDQEEFIENLLKAEKTGELVTRVAHTVESLPGFYEGGRDLYIFKLGCPEINWVPQQEDLKSFAELLEIARKDPFAAIIYHHGLEISRVPGFWDRPLRVQADHTVVEEPAPEAA